jgi:hypothetical protein
MKPYTENIVTFRALHAGYAEASARFTAASKQREELASFHPLFEALNWAVAMDDQVRKHWVPDGKPLNWEWRNRVAGAEAVQGLRWARNGVHHEWSDALVTSEGFQYPKTFPVVYFEWVWRPAVELPGVETADPDGRAAYEEHLQGRPARVTLGSLSDVFLHIANLLEPQRPAVE